ncbi:phage repressor protein [Staphylococcus simulans]|uniref:BRO-N domain-containing protein n=1 Tax=Staphylococcus simulans TaxID=1286 RepID=UPI0021D3C37A|nr:BRO family protein [Staphylococcus simulans]UXR34707.1 phage repressor protein [Staphylococcus simulans]
MKIEKWNGHSIRFMLKKRQWWAVAMDVTQALGIINTAQAIKNLESDGICNTYIIDRKKRTQNVSLINETSIYELILKSRKKEAQAFKKWVYEVVSELRQSMGYEGFKVFAMLDKEHQKEMMKRLSEGMTDIKQKLNERDYCKANCIANKAIANLYGYSKMIKKEDMTPQMLKEREEILNDVVNLMIADHKFNLGIRVSQVIYSYIDDQKRKVKDTASTIDNSDMDNTKQFEEVG